MKRRLLVQNNNHARRPESVFFGDGRQHVGSSHWQASPADDRGNSLRPNNTLGESGGSQDKAGRDSSG